MVDVGAFCHEIAERIRFHSNYALGMGVGVVIYGQFLDLWRELEGCALKCKVVAALKDSVEWDGSLVFPELTPAVSGMTKREVLAMDCRGMAAAVRVAVDAVAAIGQADGYDVNQLPAIPDLVYGPDIEVVDFNHGDYLALLHSSLQESADSLDALSASITALDWTLPV